MTTARPKTTSGNAVAQIPLFGPDQMRLLWRRLFDDLGRSGRLLDGPQQRHLRQSQEHSPRPARSAGTERATPSPDDPALFEEFCDEFTREMNRLRTERDAVLHGSPGSLDPGALDRRLQHRAAALVVGLRYAGSLRCRARTATGGVNPARCFTRAHAGQHRSVSGCRWMKDWGHVNLAKGMRTPKLTYQRPENGEQVTGHILHAEVKGDLATLLVSASKRKKPRTLRIRG